MASKPHAVVIPYPFQGHINPAVHLSIKLASRGFAITFINTEAVHHQTSRAHHPSSAAANGGGCGGDIFAGARASGLDIRYELISDGLPIGFDRSLNHDQYQYSLLHVSSAHVEDLFERRLSKASPPVSCLIADTFFVWPAALSKKLRIPHVSFWTEPALIFTLYYHIDLMKKNGHFATNDNRNDAITYLPGVPTIETTDLTSYLQDTDTTSVVHQIIFKAFDSARDADFVLCNSVQELEPRTVAAFNLQKPFYPVGPIFPAGFTRSTVATSLWAESDCTHWLDSMPPGSVLYISFGSYAHVTKRDLLEIANGVLASNVSFIWVIRPDIVSSDEPDPLPAGFVEATKGRGTVVPWCCQVDVLSHASTGGFLTHCGWNSVLESMWSGVPMLCFPLLTDQFTNRKLVVKDWKIGIDAGDVGKVDREEVRVRICRLMGGEVGMAVREELKEVRRKLERAATEDGSSQRNFDRFLEDLSRHASKSKVKMGAS